MTTDDHEKLTWIKSTKSSGGQQCVEHAVPNEPDTVLIRDSKNPDGDRLALTHRQFRDWLDAAKEGEFDHLI